MSRKGNDLFVTDDGSHSLLSLQFDVPYHSRHGAIQESEHVFIEAGLKDVLQNPSLQKVRILEMGFGTGLNALLTLRCSRTFPNIKFEYRAVEAFPLAIDEVKKLNYWEQLGESGDSLPLLHAAHGCKRVVLAPNFNLEVANSSFLEGVPQSWPEGFDLLYFDAFAPASQPELWEPAALEIAYNALKTGGVFVTYCAKGQFKRDLKSVGFQVEPIPGPPGKREMTRARKL